MRKWSLSLAAIVCTTMAAPPAAQAQTYGQLQDGPFTAVSTTHLASLVDALEASLVNNGGCATDGCNNCGSSSKCGGCDTGCWVDTHDQCWTH